MTPEERLEPPIGPPPEPPIGPPTGPPPPAPEAGRLASAAALVTLGLLAGLAVGWVLFRSEPSPTGATPMGQVAGVTGAFGVDVTNDPELGPPDAPITIVEFSDFDCPFCTRFATRTAPQLRRQYGDRIRWVFLNLPLQSIHPRAYDAALAGECAHEQTKFWEWYDAMFSGRFDSSRAGLARAAQSIGLDPERFDQCLTHAEYASEVAADVREADKFFINGTPTFFVNGQRLSGAQPAEVFATIIDSLLAGS